MELKELRKQKQMNQFELAKRSRVSRFRIQQYEGGYVLLNREELRAINKVLKGASNVTSKKK